MSLGDFGLDKIKSLPSAVSKTIAEQASKLNPASQQQATNILSSSIENFARGGFNNLLHGKKFDAGARDVLAGAVNDLSGLIDRDTGQTIQNWRNYAQIYSDVTPKLGFMFMVSFEFEFNTPLASSINSDLRGKMYSFYVKSVDRPKITYEYDEVNMYNHRTRVLRRMNYDPVAMSFYDDGNSAVLEFVNTYYKMMSPVANIPVGSSTEMFTNGGMNFSRGGEDSSGTGHPNVISETATQIIKKVKLYHVYGNGSRMYVFEFINPRIENITLSALDMSQSDVSTVDLTFNFDALVMEDDNTGNLAANVPDFHPTNDILGGEAGLPRQQAPGTTGDDYNVRTGDEVSSTAEQEGLVGTLLGAAGGALKDYGTSYLKQKASNSLSKMIGKSSLGGTALGGALGNLGGNVIGKGITTVSNGVTNSLKNLAFGKKTDASE